MDNNTKNNPSDSVKVFSSSNNKNKPVKKKSGGCGCKKVRK
ncbi:hypothetical protein RGU12_05345 [Fredinandcohnia sp. QZ13]|nr:hypothetical protein [Fredinandcohnia sp. QZ13]MDR4886977.1 hypothetical protein [Fredinandcohnia sp. QZ13]